MQRSTKAEETEMKYKTRGGTDPHGKPKVYFTGAAEDCNASFERISDLILSMYNCVIYYEENPYEPELTEELLLGMQLVVMTVTSRYTDQDSFAHNTVFRLAVRHHIPVLPLLEEAGIESAFNRKCGNIQYLNLNSADATEISSVRKLKNFLNAVLLGDELTEQIMQAFDAYVFMSYRKKDRKYANELIRLIHSNDLCRDLAIWYDEYLVPGENFNHAIEKAMKNSSLFTMVVTDSLLEKPNYVMDMEYPAARRDKKPILPVLMTGTDETRLKGCYDEIPHPVKPECLKEALQKALENILEPERDNSPKHLFFIGLAYLEGIYAEVNHARALEMIQTAAEQGLTEAMQKLTDMYLHGNGVPVDHEAAIAWEKRLAAAHKAGYDADGDAESVISWFKTLLSVGDHTSMYIGEKAGCQAYEHLAREVRDFLNRSGLYRPAHFIVLAHRKQSEILLKHDQIPAALCQIRKALRESKRFYKNELEYYSLKPEDAFLEQAALDRGTSQIAYGDILFAKGCRKKACIQYALGFAMVRQAELLAGEHDQDPDILMQIETEKIAMCQRHILSIAENSMIGSIMTSDLTDEPDDAESAGEAENDDLFAVTDITEKIRRDYAKLRTQYLETKSKEHLIRFASACESVGKMYASQKRYFKAIEAYQEITEMLEPVRKADSYFLFPYMLIRYYAQLGILLARTDDLPGAGDALQKCSTLCRSMESEADRMTVRRCRFALHYAEGTVNAISKDYSAAIEQLLLAREAYADEKTTPSFRKEMFALYMELGSVYQESGEYKTALKSFRTALRFSRNEKGGYWFESLSSGRLRKMQINRRIADLYMKQGRCKEAFGYYKKAIRQATIAALERDPDSMFEKGELYSRAADCRRRMIRDHDLHSGFQIRYAAGMVLYYLNQAKSIYMNLSRAFPDVACYAEKVSQIQTETAQWEKERSHP